MGGADLPDNWLDEVAAPSIRGGIATVARRNLAALAFEEWPEEWQEAFQDAVVKVWQSETARQLVAEARWEDMRRFAHRVGGNAAIDILRRRGVETRRQIATPHDGDDEHPSELAGQAAEQPEQTVLDADRRRELMVVLDRVQALLPELPESPDHPQRTILGLRLHLLEQELRAGPTGDGETEGEAPSDTETAHGSPEDDRRAALVRLLLGTDTAVPTYRAARLDLQIAGILRPARVAGDRATEETRREAAQWVRTEVSRTRQRLRTLYERRYGEPLGW